MQSYRKHCIQNQATIRDEAMYEPNKEYGLLLDSASRKRPSINLIAQSLLYFDKIVISDPVVEISRPKDPMKDMYTEYIFGQKASGISRLSLAGACRFMKECTAAVAQGYLIFIPASLLYESEPGMSLLAPLYYKDGLTSDLEKWFRRRARVSAARIFNGKLILEHSKSLKRSSFISIHIEGDEHSQAFAYTSMGPSDKTSTAQNSAWIRLGKPEKPATNAHFDTWVNQSIGRVAHRKLSEIAIDLYQASALKLRYITQSPLTDDLLRYKIPKKTPFELRNKIAENVFRLNLPILDRATVDDIVRVRDKMTKQFEDFRIGMSERLAEVATIDDLSERNKKIASIAYGFQKTEVDKLTQGLDRARLSAALTSVIAFVAASPYLGNLKEHSSDLFNVLMAGCGSAAITYLLQKRSSPGYFLWELDRETQRSKRKRT